MLNSPGQGGKGATWHTMCLRGSKVKKVGQIPAQGDASGTIDCGDTREKRKSEKARSVAAQNEPEEVEGEGFSRTKTQFKS